MLFDLLAEVQLPDLLSSPTSIWEVAVQLAGVSPLPNEMLVEVQLLTNNNNKFYYFQNINPMTNVFAICLHTHKPD